MSTLSSSCCSRFHSLSPLSPLVAPTHRKSLAYSVSRVNSRAVRARHDENNDAVVALRLLTTPPLPFAKGRLANTEGRRIIVDTSILEPRSRPRYSPLKISSFATFWKYTEVCSHRLDHTVRNVTYVVSSDNFLVWRRNFSLNRPFRPLKLSTRRVLLSQEYRFP